MGELSLTKVKCNSPSSSFTHIYNMYKLALLSRATSNRGGTTINGNYTHVGIKILRDYYDRTESETKKQIRNHQEMRHY